MGKDTGRRVVLTLSERTRVLDELNTILARANIVGEHLEVASARQGATVTVWTDDQLDSILDAARALRNAVERAPLEAD